MVIVVMGAAGAGKSTVGRALADELGWTFVDADDLHVASSIEKMGAGIGLSDADRWPWLERVRGVMEAAGRTQRSLVVACSALRESYRTYLFEGLDAVRLVFLQGPAELLQSRLQRRTGHFAAANLLHSQLEALEPPAGALTLDAGLPVAVLVDRIRESLRS